MILQNVNTTKLHDELANVGIVSDAFTLDNGDCKLIFTTNTNMDLVQSIVDAHDPTPIPPPLSETERIRLEMARSNAEMFEMMVSMIGGGM